jgi:hypothetical protein
MGHPDGGSREKRKATAGPSTPLRCAQDDRLQDDKGLRLHRIAVFGVSALFRGGLMGWPAYRVFLGVSTIVRNREML